MNRSSDTSNGVLIEALYFAGGIRSTIYGVDTRPSWLPSIENIGLHNDVYLASGEFAVELTRLAFADASKPGSGVTWLGVYATATDISGDRGNYCCVGMWLING